MIKYFWPSDKQRITYTTALISIQISIDYVCAIGN